MKMERHKMQFTLEKEKVYGSYNGRNHLSNSGCNRSSFNFHTADRKKKIIKKSIGKSGDHSKSQTKMRFPRCDEKGLIQIRFTPDEKMLHMMKMKSPSKIKED